MSADNAKPSRRDRVLVAVLLAIGSAALVFAVVMLATGSLSRPAPEGSTVGDLASADTTGPAVTADTAPSAERATPPSDEPAVTAPLDPSSDEADETPSTETIVGTRPGYRAPALSLRSLDGRVVSLSEFAGQVVILDFWASWCGPCRVSMPTLDRLWKEVRDQGVVLVGVSLDRSASDASNYLTSQGYDEMIALWESSTASRAAALSYGVSGIPRTFIIDREGIIRFAGHPATLTRSILAAFL